MNGHSPQVIAFRIMGTLLILTAAAYAITDIDPGRSAFMVAVLLSGFLFLYSAMLFKRLNRMTKFHPPKEPDMFVAQWDERWYRYKYQGGDECCEFIDLCPQSSDVSRREQERIQAEKYRNDVLASLAETPPTEHEMDVAERYFKSEATDEELRNSITSRLERALAKLPSWPRPKEKSNG